VDGPGPEEGWTHRALLTPGSRRLALGVMLVSAFFPVAGLGVDLCPFHHLTGLPCPGCGMSRAMAAFSQGDFVAALGLHPFVVFAWPTLLALAVLGVVPERLRTAVEGRLDRHGPALTRGYRLVLTAFVGFGILRLVVLFSLDSRFP
jgi:hypothetical protein